MEIKDAIALIGIALTFAISCANFIYTYRANRRTSFVNTVTTSRLRWIDSLRDKVSEFMAVSAALFGLEDVSANDHRNALLLQRDVLAHQIALHLNPNDLEDQKIRTLVDHVKDLADKQSELGDFQVSMANLREATGKYLKKEWNRVKKESVGERLRA